MDAVTGSFLAAAAIVGVGYGIAEWQFRRSLQRDVEQLRRMAAEAEHMAAGLRQVRDILDGALGELRSAEARLRTHARPGVGQVIVTADPNVAKRIADEALRNANRSSRRA